MQSMTTPRLVFGFREKDRAEIERLLREYETQLGVSLCFQAFDDELAGLPGLYVPAVGHFLTAWDETCGGLLACVALKPDRSRKQTCEMKRLYVRPKARGTGLGRKLAQEITEVARRMGYQRMVLDTLPWLAEAQALYVSMGFRQTGVSGASPQVFLFERDLTA
jgi:GNAT superfamily N-acetyltransferase